MSATDNAAEALWFTAPRKAERRAESIAPGAEGTVTVRMRWSGISRGTERLVFEGRVPETDYATMRAPFQGGAFPFPVKYGYCAVGEVEQGPDNLRGRAVFALHPHQTRFVVPAAAVQPLPDGLPLRRAILTANMETALNAVWDSGAAPGDRIAVVGAGAVGLLTAALAARIPATRVTLIDVDEGRAPLATALGCAFALPSAAPADCDLAFHTSATAPGLATALGTLAMEGTCIEMSWHGAGLTPAPLGGAFHSRRLKLVSSQVGNLPPLRRPRWDYARRLGVALDLLATDPRLDALITGEVAFADLPERVGDILAPGAQGIATAVRYE
jgi:threonine dehydrogenase-like Zn-dependent dehydrogenase